MNDTIIKFLKSTESSRISFRGYIWVRWSKKHQRWALSVLRNEPTADLVFLTDDINDALERVYAAPTMPALEDR